MTPDLCFTAGRERESNARMINGIKKKRKIKGKKKYEVSIRSACLYNMYVRPLLKETRYCYTCLLQISRCSQRVVIFFLFFVCFRFPFFSFICAICMCHHFIQIVSTSGVPAHTSAFPEVGPFLIEIVSHSRDSEQADFDGREL